MLKKSLSSILIAAFISSSIMPMPVYAQPLLGLPEPGTMVSLSPAYAPVMIKGITVHKDNPFLFDFIVDVGQDKMQGEALKKEGTRLIKYFLAGLTIPEKDLWVNLSPYEKDRAIAKDLGQTEMGRDLLAQDYMLKQITASLIYPEKQLGKTFWDTVYAKAQEKYGTTQIPVNTFNKVWIMADRAEVFERNQTAFVVDSHLKVMLEEDYLALQKHVTPSNNSHSIASNIVRQIVLPELEKEVNAGKNFANLRQIFNSLILAGWYKSNLKDALLNQVYSNHSTTQGIDLKDKTIKEQIYQRYLQAYKKGVFNYIKEDVLNAQGEPMPRKYFSGGVMGSPAMASPKVTSDPAELAKSLANDNGEMDFATLVSNQSNAEMATGVTEPALAQRLEAAGDKLSVLEHAKKLSREDVQSLARDIKGLREGDDPAWQWKRFSKEDWHALLGLDNRAQTLLLRTNINAAMSSSPQAAVSKGVTIDFAMKASEAVKMLLPAPIIRSLLASISRYPEDFNVNEWLMDLSDQLYSKEYPGWPAGRVLEFNKDKGLDLVYEVDPRRFSEKLKNRIGVEAIKGMHHQMNRLKDKYQGASQRDGFNKEQRELLGSLDRQYGLGGRLSYGREFYLSGTSAAMLANVVHGEIPNSSSNHHYAFEDEAGQYSVLDNQTNHRFPINIKNTSGIKKYEFLEGTDKSAARIRIWFEDSGYLMVTLVSQAMTTDDQIVIAGDGMDDRSLALEIWDMFSNTGIDKVRVEFKNPGRTFLLERNGKENVAELEASIKVHLAAAPIDANVLQVVRQILKVDAQANGEILLLSERGGNFAPLVKAAETVRRKFSYIIEQWLPNAGPSGDTENNYQLTIEAGDLDRLKGDLESWAPGALSVMHLTAEESNVRGKIIWNPDHTLAIVKLNKAGWFLSAHSYQKKLNKLQVELIVNGEIRASKSIETTEFNDALGAGNMAPVLKELGIEIDAAMTADLLTGKLPKFITDNPRFAYDVIDELLRTHLSTHSVAHNPLQGNKIALMVLDKDQLGKDGNAVLKKEMLEKVLEYMCRELVAYYRKHKLRGFEALFANGVVEKKMFTNADPKNGRTVLDDLIKQGILEEVSATEVRLKNGENMPDAIMPISEGNDPYKAVRVFLNQSYEKKPFELHERDGGYAIYLITQDVTILNMQTFLEQLNELIRIRSVLFDEKGNFVFGNIKKFNQALKDIKSQVEGLDVINVQRTRYLSIYDSRKGLVSLVPNIVRILNDFSSVNVLKLNRGLYGARINREDVASNVASKVIDLLDIMIEMVSQPMIKNFVRDALGQRLGGGSPRELAVRSRAALDFYVERKNIARQGKSLVNPAMLDVNGGIDLNTTAMKWKISKEGNGVEMNIDPAMIARIKREGIASLTPVIFNITPVASVWLLVGLTSPAK